MGREGGEEGQTGGGRGEREGGRVGGRLMVFTVHGIVLPLCWKYIQPSRGTHPIHCKNHGTTVTITCTQVLSYTSYQ